MRSPGKKIGLVNYKEEEKWRCATCKMANDNSLEACGRCRDPRVNLMEKRPPAGNKLTGGAARRNNSEAALAKPPPMKFTLCKKIPKNKQVELERVKQQAAAAVVNKHKNTFVPQPNGQMMTMKDLQAQNTSEITQPRQTRVNKEPMEVQLAKIAANSANPGEAKWKRSVEHMK